MEKEYSSKKLGHFFMIVGPSGVGKTTIIENITKKHHPNLQKSVSYTTRPKRDNEQHKVHYYFISKEEYEKMHKNNEFIMHYEYKANNQYYGTSRTEILNKINQNISIIDETDEESVIDMIDNNLLDKELFSAIYLTNPDEETCVQRNQELKGFSKEELQNRLKVDKERLKKFQETKQYYDLIIINKNQEETIKELEEFIKSKTK